MNFKKAIGYGALIWVIVFAIVSALIAFDVYGALWLDVVIAVVAGILAMAFAGLIKPKTIGQALLYGLTWVIVSVILDAVITMQFEPTIFMAWTVWLAYVLILVAPIAKIQKNESTPSESAPIVSDSARPSEETRPEKAITAETE